MVISFSPPKKKKKKKNQRVKGAGYGPFGGILRSHPLLFLIKNFSNRWAGGEKKKKKKKM